MAEPRKADYVIVGSGSAGAALAYRLGEAGHSVLVVEYGGSDAGPLIQMPGALSYPMNMAHYDWGYATEPEPGLGGRRLACPRGKVIGGSSSINGMVYVRGHAGDFAHWAESGARGWDYAHVLPYFRRMEQWHGAGDGGDPSWRGTDGPLHVSRGPRANPLIGAFLKAGQEAGHPYTADYNGAVQEGVGPFDTTIWQGRRWSTANAYLRPAVARFGVKILRGLATRVVIEEGRARGVMLRTREGEIRIDATREVILAAGAINSPKLLLHSGIGPGRALQALGIEVVADRPGVGRNLQDHLEVYVQAACREPVSLYSYWNLFGKARVGAEWLFRKSGPGATNQIEAGAFLRSSPEAEYPDVQFHFIPIAVRYDGKASAQGHGFQIHTGPMRSEARGHITLSTPDPAAPPSIRFNYMTAPEDWRDFRRATRMAQTVLRQPAFARYFDHEIQPGVESDEGIDAFVREHAESAYHPCGACRMGAADDPMAVVDPETRVIGVRGLRVSDSSIFPRITYGNLNAPSIMVGEKAADHVLGQGMLAADERVRERVAEPA
ncbi:choline dehydrogenase [Ovoidimarina sediminis]|uniref:choline dehydrogenase n=1 Tax=Ovoidimarina sediminis TaxID=3079856 RepID=UPI00291408AD|nr:choline dehydrogenase [Rhodophyticola sp. MJ-SS7]MDU8945092.1 choline dehydrogenase [Rhodophyticola sp. MJ-SS7]